MSVGGVIVAWLAAVSLIASGDAQSSSDNFTRRGFGGFSTNFFSDRFDSLPANIIQGSSDWLPGEQCTRSCDDQPRTCYFEWHVERYSVMGPACRNCSEGKMSDCWSAHCVPADGFKKGIITINRMLPGPSIQVCQNDRLVIDLFNDMADESTAIHWHGIRQMGSQYMDGVPMVTQCPIQPGNMFRYDFRVPEAGTFFYHSHVGSQKLDGVDGALIVREASGIHSHLYDEDIPEHVITVQDWSHLRGIDFIPGLHIQGLNQVPDAVLINGMGPLSVNKTNRNIPVANFTVESGKRYRFRLIGAICMTCSYALKIQNHTLMAISADGGRNFKPTMVDSIGFNSGERFDFILTANQTPGTYFIFIQSLSPFCPGLRQVALLRYSSANLTLALPQEFPPTGNIGKILNHPNATCNATNTNEICYYTLAGEENAPSIRDTNAPHILLQYALGASVMGEDFLFRPGSYQRYEEPVFGRYVAYLMNNISFKFPPSPLLSQGRDVPESAFCRRECFSKNIMQPCACTSIDEVPIGAIVDMIVFDTDERDGFDHPFHLHGFNFHVLEMGLFPEKKEERGAKLAELRQRLIGENIVLRTRPMKDTISIPARGWALLRFVADNPGFWLFHCHFVFHLESGMGGILRVGTERDVRPPPPGFPTCGNFYG